MNDFKLQSFVNINGTEHKSVRKNQVFNKNKIQSKNREMCYFIQYHVENKCPNGDPLSCSEMCFKISNKKWL